MHRTEPVAAVASTSGQPRPAVEEVMRVVGEALVAGDEVTLPGLLTAARVERAERQGRDPQTGEAITTSASSGVELSAATALKTQVRGS